MPSLKRLRNSERKPVVEDAAEESAEKKMAMMTSLKKWKISVASKPNGSRPNYWQEEKPMQKQKEKARFRKENKSSLNPRSKFSTLLETPQMNNSLPLMRKTLSRSPNLSWKSSQI